MKNLPSKGAVMCDNKEFILFIKRVFKNYYQIEHSGSSYGTGGVVWNLDNRNIWTVASNTSYDKYKPHQIYIYFVDEILLDYINSFPDHYDHLLDGCSKFDYKYYKRHQIKKYHSITFEQVEPKTGSDILREWKEKRTDQKVNTDIVTDIMDYDGNQVSKSYVDGVYYKGHHRIVIKYHKNDMFNVFMFNVFSRTIKNLVNSGYTEKNLSIEGMSYAMVNLQYKEIIYRYDLSGYKNIDYKKITGLAEEKDFLEFTESIKPHTNPCVELPYNNNKDKFNLNPNSYEQKQTNVSQGADESDTRRTRVERSEIQIGGCGNGLEPSDRKRRERSARLGEKQRSTGQGLRVGRRSQRSLTI